MTERRAFKAKPGTLLARVRIAAHNAFDPLWQSGKMSRSQAYAWLAQQLGLPKEQCHMLMFDIAMCERVVEVCAAHGFGPRSVADDFEVIE